MQLDVELALTKVAKSELDAFERVLPTGYFIEDRSAKGWGLVIQSSESSQSDINAALRSFLDPLVQLKMALANRGGIVRVAIFYATVDCTFRLDCYDCLNAFKFPLEISTYPTSD